MSLLVVSFAAHAPSEQHLEKIQELHIHHPRDQSLSWMTSLLSQQAFESRLSITHMTSLICGALSSGNVKLSLAPYLAVVHLKRPLKKPPLKKIKENLCMLLRLNSSAQSFFLPGMWLTCRAMPLACAQDATALRKWHNGQVVVKSLLRLDSAAVLSLPVGCTNWWAVWRRAN